MMNFIFVENEEKVLKEFLFSGRQELHWTTTKSMQAFLALIPRLYQVIGITIPPGESWQCTTKTGDIH